MRKIIILISLFTLIGCSTIKVNKNEKLTYHILSKEEKLINGKIIKEKYEVEPGTNIKHGNYERYDKNFLILEQGKFYKGEKIGIWKIWNAKDRIFIEKDFDKDSIEIPIIEKRYLNYPMVFVEERDTLPQGLIMLYLNFSDNCQLIKSEVIKGIDQEFDEEVLSRYQNFVKLSNKYEIPIEECAMKKDSLKINFKL